MLQAWHAKGRSEVTSSLMPVCVTFDVALQGVLQALQGLDAYNPALLQRNEQHFGKHFFGREFSASTMRETLACLRKLKENDAYRAAHKLRCKQGKKSYVASAVEYSVPGAQRHSVLQIYSLKEDLPVKKVYVQSADSRDVQTIRQTCLGLPGFAHPGVLSVLDLKSPDVYRLAVTLKPSKSA